MKEEHRQAIVDALINFVDNDICKIYEREYFYYNKQGIKLYETNDNGISVVQTVCKEGDFEIKPSKLTAGEIQFEKFKGINKDEILELQRAYFNNPVIAVVDDEGNKYTVELEDHSVIKTLPDGETLNLGCGNIVLKVGAISKKTKLGNAKIVIVPITYNDYEIIPHHFDEDANNAEIKSFMDEYIYKPFEFGKNVVGVEVNFNKEFYVPEVLDSVEDIMEEINALNNNIKEIVL